MATTQALWPASQPRPLAGPSWASTFQPLGCMAIGRGRGVISYTMYNARIRVGMQKTLAALPPLSGCLGVTSRTIGPSSPPWMLPALGYTYWLCTDTYRILPIHVRWATTEAVGKDGRQKQPSPPVTEICCLCCGRHRLGGISLAAGTAAGPGRESSRDPRTVIGWGHDPENTHSRTRTHNRTPLPSSTKQAMMPETWAEMDDSHVAAPPDPLGSCLPYTD